MIKFLVNKVELSGGLVRWFLLLEKFDYAVEYKSDRMHLQADHLSKLSKNVGFSPIDDRLVDDIFFVVNVQPKWYRDIITILLGLLLVRSTLLLIYFVNFVQYINLVIIVNNMQNKSSVNIVNMSDVNNALKFLFQHMIVYLRRQKGELRRRDYLRTNFFQQWRIYNINLKCVRNWFNNNDDPMICHYFSQTCGKMSFLR
jgi:hypothetical protein